jgi:hypothetical protein
VRPLRILLALSIFVPVLVVACGSDDTTGGGPNAGPDGGGRDGTSGGGGDANVGGDSTTGANDGGSDAASSGDTSTGDAQSSDASGDASDTGAVDSSDGASAADGEDGASADAADGSASCVVDVFGDYYLRSDGTLVYFYNASSQQVVNNSVTGLPLKTVTAVAPQFDHACALLSDQTVWCWASLSGGNANGDLGNGVTGGTPTLFSATQVVTEPADAGTAYLTDVMALESSSAGYYTHPTCAIKSDHTLWCWGRSGGNGGDPTGVYWGTNGSSNAVPYAFPLASGPAPADGGSAPLIQADQVAIEGSSLCYLSSGQVYCLGMDTSGDLGNGTAGVFQAYPVAVSVTNGLPSTVDAIASSYATTCAIAGGSVWCWGSDTWAQVGNPGAPSACGVTCQWTPTPVQVAADDGGITSFPDAGESQSPLGSVTQVTTGYLEQCALDTGGVIRCWGSYYIGGTKWTEATIYDSGADAGSSNVTKLAFSAQEEDIQQGVRYLTSSHVLVKKDTVVTPICP